MADNSIRSNSITSKSAESNLWAIVPAAGVGARMASHKPKQYLQVKGKTIIEHTLDKLFHLPLAGLTVCIAQQDDDWEKLKVAHEKLLSVVAGGKTRAHSVLNGLQYISDFAASDDWVMVHDAARPAVSVKALQNLVSELQEHEVGGLLAVPVNDTVKLAGTDQIVKKTLDRSQLWCAQTPQMFRLGVLKQALQQALTKEQDITDEASAIELSGLNPKIVMGETSNIKITTPADMSMFEVLAENEAVNS